MTANPDYAHRQMMAAIKAISDGRQLDDVASVPSDYGREFKIRDALINGERKFSEPFEDDDWKVALAAFAELKLVPVSRREGECCTGSKRLKSIARRVGSMPIKRVREFPDVTDRDQRREPVDS
jgi:hypothetical protein